MGAGVVGGFLLMAAAGDQAGVPVAVAVTGLGVVSSILAAAALVRPRPKRLLRPWTNEGSPIVTTSATHIAALAVPGRVRAWAADLRLGGGLLFLGGATILMGIITAEALYPGTFSTGANEISDLGGTRPPNSVILQPSATIFDVSMALIGSLVMAGSCVRPPSLWAPVGDDPDGDSRRGSTWRRAVPWVHRRSARDLLNGDLRLGRDRRDQRGARNGRAVPLPLRRPWESLRW